MNGILKILISQCFSQSKEASKLHIIINYFKKCFFMILLYWLLLPSLSFSDTISQNSITVNVPQGTLALVKIELTSENGGVYKFSSDQTWMHSRFFKRDYGDSRIPLAHPGKIGFTGGAWRGQTKRVDVWLKAQDLSIGSYSTTLNIEYITLKYDSDGSCKSGCPPLEGSFTLPVTLNVIDNMAISPSSISIEGEADSDDISTSFTVTFPDEVTATSLQFFINDDQPWLSTSYSVGFRNLAPYPWYKPRYFLRSTNRVGTVNVDFDTSNLTPGIYTGSIYVTAGLITKSIPVALTVNDRDSCPEITSFSGSSTSMNAEYGIHIEFNGEINTSSDESASWKLSIVNEAGQEVFSKEENSSEVSNVVWNGLVDGKVEAGEYSATLSICDEGCDSLKEVRFIINPLKNDCGFNVDFLSSVNIASGNLSHSQNLFNLGETSFTLSYNSKDNYSGLLSKGWTHSYDINLKEHSDGSVVLHVGNAGNRLYTADGNSYASQSDDYSILSKKAAGGWQIIEKSGIIFDFGIDGNILSIMDRNGRETAVTYEAGSLSIIKDNAGKTTTVITDSEGNIAALTDPSGNSYRLHYDGEGNLSELVYPSADGSNSSWTYTYYDNSFMETKTDPNGYTVTYTYDDQWRVLIGNDSEDGTKSIVYPTAEGDVKSTTVTQKDGGIWTYTYDTKAGTITSQTDPGGNTTSYEYDDNRNLISQTGPDGSTTSYTYDDYGNRTSETDAEGNATSYTYNQYGQVLSVTDAEGNVSSYAYDDKGNLSSTTDASGATTSYEYDSKGNVTKITDTTGGETVMSYDDSNNLVSVRDTSGATTFFAYNAAGNMTGQTDANGNTTTFEYNSLNQLVKVTDPQGKATSYSYDRSGNRTSQTDASGNTTYYEYNHKGQVVKVTDALGGETKYTYGGTSCSACGSKGDNLTSITDAKGNTTKFEYDHLSRLVKEIGPLGYSTGYGYDAKGRLTSKTDAEGNTISYSYDALGRLLAKSYPDNTGESYSYDLKGNLLTAANGNMGYTFSYDAGNRVTSVTDSNGRDISYSNDTSGRKTKMTGPNGEEIAYSYDDSNRLNSIASDAGDFIFTYDSLGRRVGLSYPHGVNASYSYDTSGRLTDLIHKTSGASVIASNSYSHDNVGNRLSNENHDRTAEYTYDLIYRLTEAHYNTPGFSTNDSHSKGKGKGKSTVNTNAIANQTEIYSYDPVGNRLASQKNKTYSYNAANQLVIENGTTYIYDKNGNLTQKSGSDEFASYFYDYENRLIKVERTEGTSVIVANYKYDPFGRRIEKKVTENGSTTTTRFFYDNEDILFEYDEKGTIGNQYVHGPGIDEPLALIQRKGNYYYHADGLGSIVAITDESAKVVQDYDYYYFGELKNQKNRIKQPYKYTGREWDKETGLYFYRARYYDPEIGRFTQKDPIGFRGGINLYGYVQQDPINWIDPYGLFSFKYYGNYGGPGWTAGKWTSWDDMTDLQKRRAVRPMDKQDACYKKHDICYGDCRSKCKTSNCPEKCERDGFNSCDRELKNCLIGIGEMTSKLEEAYRLGAIVTFEAQPTARDVYSGLSSSLPQIWDGLTSSF